MNGREAEQRGDKINTKPKRPELSLKHDLLNNMNVGLSCEGKKCT